MAHHRLRAGAAMAQHAQQHLDDDLVIERGLAGHPRRLPALDELASTGNLRGPDLGVKVQIDVDLPQPLALDLAVAQQIEQRVVHPHLQTLLQRLVRGTGFGFFD